MNQKFLDDYKRMIGCEYKFGLRTIVQILGRHHIRYMYWWRSYEAKPNKIKKLILYRYAQKYGIEISTTASIGSGLNLGHPYNITVGGNVTIGNHVNIHKGCTIGRENRGKREGVPTICDNVWIGINSTVVGKITIGSDVMICPNSFVNFDVPDHSIVIGNPGVIHYKNNATEGYL